MESEVQIKTSDEAATRILVVDDEKSIRISVQAFLQGAGYTVDVAEDALIALRRLEAENYDVVVSDIVLPGRSGVELLKSIRSISPDIQVIMMTGEPTVETAAEAVRSMASDYLAKPVSKMVMLQSVSKAVKMKRLLDENRRLSTENQQYQNNLELTVQKRTKELRHALQETTDSKHKTHQAHLETIERLVLAAEFKDEDTAFHIKRMSRYCRLIAQKIGLSPEQCELIFNASPMHDVGKMGIPDAILLKPGKLNPAEWEIMKTHAEIGAHILSGSTSELLQAGEIVARSHHEKWDGSGYPLGLVEEAIPLWGRIAAVADVFDALTSKRLYKEPFPIEKTIQIMHDGRGTHFDPHLFDTFLDNMTDVLKIYEQYGEMES